jgi:TRAP-type C4-dicarboxylate transport system permease small subunit
MVQRSSAIHYPMGLVYAALPVSGLLMFIATVEVMVKTVLKLFEMRTGQGKKLTPGGE